MTDNEIISIDEAIRHCYETYFERDDLCRECREEHKQLAKWLEELKESRNTINRQKAEIERLREIANHKCQKCVSRTIECAKSEAIKEFAERLKHFIIPQKADGYTREIVLKRDIDNIVKEMTEVSE